MPKRMEIYKVLQEVNEKEGKHFLVYVLKKKDGGGLIVQKAARGKKNVERLRRELKMLKKIKEEKVPHAQRLLNYNYGIDQLHIRTAYYTEGDLLDYVNEKSVILKDLLRMFVDIARALATLHSLQCAHYDVKPENIFLSLDQRGVLRGNLGDFGQAGLGVAVKAKGTEYYCPSEMLELAKKIIPSVDGKACDVYSFAHTILLVCDQPSVSPSLPASLQHFLNKCTALQPKERPTMDELLLTLKESLGKWNGANEANQANQASNEGEQTLECIFEGLSISKGSRSP